jgi:hypothetical protein
MAVNPAFATTPRIGLGQVATANTARDGSGTLGTAMISIITGASTGTRIVEVIVDATVTTTAGMVRLYLHDGTNTRMFDEIPVTATTVSASVAAFRASRTYDNLVLPSASWSLRASTHNAEAINVIALGADL